MKRRIVRNGEAPAGLYIFKNYARSKVAIPKADDVETLVPQAAMDALTNGDPEPFYKIEAIDFPAKGSGGVYDGSFFKSFINVTRERPIPGSKRGHEWASRGNSDFYTVGGRIDSQDNGKTGTAYLKIYMPPKGDTTDNVGLIRDAKAGMVHFSLVSHPDFNVKTEKDDMGQPIQVRHFTASMGAERNDAMEYGGGAMTQIVNSSGISLDLDAARALIEEGKFDKNTNVDGEPIQNGRVYRSALRRLASRANEEDRSAVGELISMIDKAQKNGGRTMDEVLEVLKNALSDHSTSFDKIAEQLGCKDRIRTDEDVQNAATVKALKEALGDDPVKVANALKATAEENATATVKNAITAELGIPEFESQDGKKVENQAFAYALQQCSGKSGDELQNAVKALREDPLLKAYAAQRAAGGGPLAVEGRQANAGEFAGSTVTL